MLVLTFEILWCDHKSGRRESGFSLCHYFLLVTIVFQYVYKMKFWILYESLLLALFGIKGLGNHDLVIRRIAIGDSYSPGLQVSVRNN